MRRIENRAVQNTADETLVEQAKLGCKESFERLVRRYYQNVLGFIAGKLRDSGEAEDVVQDTFLNVYKNIDSFDSNYKFKTWLFCIAHNCMVSHLRKKKPMPMELPDSACCQVSHEQAAEDAEQAQLLWAAAADLVPEQFTAVWLRYNQQMNIKEIARAMGRTSVNVRVLLHRARNILGEKMEKTNRNKR